MKSVVSYQDSEATWNGEVWECENKTTEIIINHVSDEAPRGPQYGGLDGYIAKYVVDKLQGCELVSLSDEDEYDPEVDY